MTEHFGQIAFESQVGLVPQSEGQVVHNIEGRITVMVNSPDDEDADDEEIDDEEVDPEQRAGVVEFLVVPLAEIRRRRGMNLWEVCDADSGGLADVYDALPEEICESAASLLFIHALEVEERFRQPGFATRIVETVIATFASSGVCIAWAGDPVGVDGGEWHDVRFERLAETDFMIRTSEVAEGLEL